MIETCDAPCFVCGRHLRNFEPDGGNHPLGGLEFTTRGHYGSALFDMEPGMLAVNICDRCIAHASERGRVLHYAPTVRGIYSRWAAKPTTDLQGEQQ